MVTVREPPKVNLGVRVKRLLRLAHARNIGAAVPALQIIAPA
jgi:hypothetical protein